MPGDAQLSDTGEAEANAQDVVEHQVAREGEQEVAVELVPPVTIGPVVLGIQSVGLRVLVDERIALVVVIRLVP